MKKLLILTSLIISGSLWADDELKTINRSLDEFESKIDYEGKTLDIQYLMTRKCAAVFDTLRELDIDYGYVDGLIQVSVGFRMMIGGNKPDGLDKTRDEIFSEVRADVKKFKGQYLNHLSTWHPSKDQESNKNELSEELFSESFREDLRLCFELSKRLPEED
jgi:hypothetical protein